jgi:hypothetical protein
LKWLRSQWPTSFEKVGVGLQSVPCGIHGSKTGSGCLSKYLVLHLSVLFHQCSTFIFNSASFDAMWRVRVNGVINLRVP